ncbi:hypothetical protein [Desulfopila aestuarii]|uniref:Uncharacterized protein n=1 Tax=Desulfopila aestuarii DSM 18488 TaxID=1121416 RepID=A0A1M7YG72_9BACT|nr:hypothetical protein [Desulfopila aestuarii]SHO51632.1 hypothetical protein SAMN02745220_04103 [Desulfopila aestuarii DSM 18488]
MSHSVRKSLLAFVSISCFAAAIILLISCSSETEKLAGTCGSCHTTTPDTNHQLSCTVCHQGDPEAKDKDKAHANMLARPAHPDNFATTCGNCHTYQTEQLAHASHYTLNNAVNLVRTAFGATDQIDTLIDIPISEDPENITQLADDMLRRRCLRCHLFSPGDDYTATRRGIGCAACHMQYKEGKLTNHTFNSHPADEQCLACHYGNRVGFDYFGRFEHDFNVEYRTPYTAAPTTDRPYGVDYHDLTPDIHQQKGLGCIDCHSGNELMNARDPENVTACADCHDTKRLDDKLPAGVQKSSDGYNLLAKGDGKQHPIPLLQHPAHFTETDVSCQACHAQWSFDDVKTHLLRADIEEYESWSRLTVQGSSELEWLLENNLDFDKEELPPMATDTITYKKRLGIWYKGYSMRRWESIPLGRTENGIISVMRPELNLSLSWIDEDETVRFDGHNAAAANHGLLPYTPHTTGPAGVFYEQRIRSFRKAEE